MKFYSVLVSPIASYNPIMIRRAIIPSSPLSLIRLRQAPSLPDSPMNLKLIVRPGR